MQTSTLSALLDGAYDGDLTIAELLAAGDLGLGTLNGLDGELIVVDGEAWQGRTDGTVRRVDPGERTPFAVVVPFAPDVSERVTAPLGHEALLARLEDLCPAGPGCDSVRIDGTFATVHARSVPRQDPPYRPLAEVVAEQSDFTFRRVHGTVVGFRFPAVADGVELVGHHLHFIDAGRERGGHVLSCALEEGTIGVERVDQLHLELPPGVVLPDPAAPSRNDEVQRLEGEG